MQRRLVLGMLCAAALSFAQAPGKGLVIALIGPPGSGKSTQAAYLKKRYKMPVIDIDKLKLKAGESVDDVVAARIRKMDARTGFVLDGYPRTRAQADKLAALIRELQLPAPIVIQLDVPDEVARERVRKQFKGRMGAFEEQLALYHREIEFAREYYPQADIWSIIGTRSPQDVSATIEALLRERQ